MKNTNAQTSKRKLTFVAATVVTSLFTLISNSSIAQAAELIKAEPIAAISLHQDAKESLALSFIGLTISQNNSVDTTKAIIAKQQNSANTDTFITLAKTSLVSE